MLSLQVSAAAAAPAMRAAKCERPAAPRGAARASIKPRTTTRRQVVAAAAIAAPAGTSWEELAAGMDAKSPLEIMDHALKTFGDDIAIAFSGAEDVALIEYAHLTGRPFRVFSLDTGRLNPETYQLFDAVEKHYGIRIEYTFPDAEETMELVRTKGLFSFYEDGHQECCRVRKVRPLRRQLKTYKAWITGQRKDQSPGTRAEVPVVQVDPVFEGVDGGEGSLIKYNPLSNMTSAEVWNFLRVMNVPTNKLHECGFVSIGCEPCTKAVLPNQHEREGRWWWEDATAKECGLHSGNKGYTEEAGAGGESKEVPDLWAGNADVPAVAKAELEKIVGGERSGDMLLVQYAPWCQFSQAMEDSYAALAKELKGTGVSVAKYNADEDRAFCEEKLQLKTFPTIVMLPEGSDKVVKFTSERRDAETLRLWVNALTTRA
ncbi:unnamed protein product [Pedinophyceae sp. YPF-701]|nr:unnamed protein product [Pedinophyceae sp. YPF-701]